MKHRIFRRLFSKKPYKKQLLTDFKFQSSYFAQNMNSLISNSPISNLNNNGSVARTSSIREQNNETVQQLTKFANYDKDPFSLIDNDLEFIKSIIFEKIINTNYELLKEISEYNLKLKGKNFRSCIIMLLSRALFESSEEAHHKNFEDTSYYYTSALLSACVEICHNATLLQDDIIDKAETRRSETAAYKVFGRSNSVFASNFLISRASHYLSTLETPYLSQIFSTMIYNLVFGELIQARNYEDDETMKEAVESYISKTYYKTASLMSLACRGVGIIHNYNEEKQMTAFNFGAHFGIAFQIADDVLDFTQSSENLGKPAFNDLKSGLVTAPTILAYSETKSDELEQMMKRKFKHEGDIDNTLRIIDQSTGIDNSERLALMHVQDSITSLSALVENNTESESFKSLVKLALKVKTRKY